MNRAGRWCGPIPRRRCMAIRVRCWINTGGILMYRRDFLKATAALSLAASSALGAEFQDRKPRVGLIGSGWYGKCDLFRPIQVAPVGVGSVGGGDKGVLFEAAGLCGQGPAPMQKPCARR